MKPRLQRKKRKGAVTVESEVQGEESITEAKDKANATQDEECGSAMEPEKPTNTTDQSGGTTATEKGHNDGSQAGGFGTPL